MGGNCHVFANSPWEMLFKKGWWTASGNTNRKVTRKCPKVIGSHWVIPQVFWKTSGKCPKTDTRLGKCSYWLM
jgi:hypothetical protein